MVSVLDTYKEKGALAADNILDKVYVSWESSAGGRPAPQALNALRYILHLELDPDSAPWPHEVVPSELGVQTLSGVRSSHTPWHMKCVPLSCQWVRGSS